MARPSLFFLTQLQAKYLEHSFPDEETGSEDGACSRFLEPGRLQALYTKLGCPQIYM